ncbi:TonB dependent receptor [Pontibacter sp. H259]|uniref:TonB dependent receptor n=1 Tax=Pontibacter sp. H259 TaxID=3133421 RepID=UPI0030C088E1
MKKGILFLLGLLCLYVSTTVVTRAQGGPATAGPGKISGTLTDSLSNKPVEFATVALLVNGSSKSEAVKLTDAAGKFQFTGLKPGVYDLTISFIGYKPKTIKRVSITTEKPDVTLNRISFSPVATQLKEVNVQALRPTITQEADKMVVSIEGTALAAGKTAYDVLATSPGVYIDQEGNIQLNGRPGTTVMLDGKLTYLSARDLRSMLESMSAENIKNIEIITNPSAKYDAEGTSGILNINLKKNTLFGVNGNVSVGGSYNFKQYAYNTTASINYKSGDWNSYINLDMARRSGGRDATFTRVFKAPTESIYFDQVADGNFVVQGPPFVRVGTDYNLNENHSIGVMANYGTNKMRNNFLTDTYIGNAPDQPNMYIEANNYNTNRFTNFTSNLHYVGKFDSLGTKLTADLDYVRITNRGEANFYNYYDTLNNDSPIRQDFLYTETPNGFDIYSGKVDFTKPFVSGAKMEMGIKASKVTSDNDSRFYFNNGDAPVLDLRRSNHFIYDETILAGYMNWNQKLGDKVAVQAGLRAEQTISEGELRTTGEVNDRSYLNFFPSLFVQQKVTDNYDINYNYSRRLNRPNYGQLNPFFAYRDPYTYWLGNPGLRAQYTHSIGITQVFKKTYNLVLNYQLTKDVISEIPIILTEDTTTVYTIGNADDSKSLSLTAITPVRIMKNWDTNNTFLVSYNKYNTLVNESPVINERMFFMLQSNHNIALPHKFKLEMNGTYQSKGAHALYVVEPRWWVNMGLKRSFLNDKLDVALNMNDVFKSQRLKLATIVSEGNVNDFDQYFRQRNIGLTLRYKFSKGQKVEENKRNNLEEVNRTGG